MPGAIEKVGRGATSNNPSQCMLVINNEVNWNKSIFQEFSLSWKSLLHKAAACMGKIESGKSYTLNKDEFCVTYMVRYRALGAVYDLGIYLFVYLCFEKNHLFDCL
jgi:hypothetical protein